MSRPRISTSIPSSCFSSNYSGATGTDFYLEHADSAALREAYLQQAVVLTPNPQHHALYADKRQLALFSDATRLEALGVHQASQQVLLEHVPRTEVVDAADRQRLWDARRGLFFKPVAGYGSRAAYRGDKLTKRVWQDILAGDYVAQAIVAPGQRMVDERDAEKTKKTMKFDLRAYAYNGAVQWVSARMYQGQTTNFRTPGGGFAPVYSTADVSGRTLHACDAENTASADHASYVFLLDEGSGVHATPHALYVALASAHAQAPVLAGQTLRLADWYVRLKDGAPDAVINETYSLIRFDADGRVDWASTPATHPHRPDVATVSEDAGWLTSAERGHMHSLLFGSAEFLLPPSSSSHAQDMGDTRRAATVGDRLISHGVHHHTTGERLAIGSVHRLPESATRLLPWTRVDIWRDLCSMVHAAHGHRCGGRDHWFGRIVKRPTRLDPTDRHLLTSSILTV